MGSLKGLCALGFSGFLAWRSGLETVGKKGLDNGYRIVYSPTIHRHLKICCRVFYFIFSRAILPRFLGWPADRPEAIDGSFYGRLEFMSVKSPDVQFMGAGFSFWSGFFEKVGSGQGRGDWSGGS